MRSKLYALTSPDALPDERSFVPATEEFSLFFQMFAGPDPGVGYEAFGFMLVSPAYVTRATEAGPWHPVHTIVVRDYDYDSLWRYLASFCESAEGATWEEVASVLSSVGRWEMEAVLPGGLR